MATTAKNFESVFQDELQAIKHRHNRMKKRPAEETITGGKTPTTALGLTGLACSGGGIRSAAFCLGVLQGLQSKNIIDRIDYLSTVSGGGYIGATLSIGMATGPNAQPGKQEALFPFGRLADEDREPPEVKHLRDNSRYLLQNGFPSVISAIVIYLRGLTMNTLVVLPLLLVAAAALVAVNPTTRHLVSNNFLGVDISPLVGTSPLPVTMIGALTIVVLLVLYAILVSVLRIRPLRDRRQGARIAAIIFAIILVSSLIELHAVVLRLVFEAEAEKAKGIAIGAAEGGRGIFRFIYGSAENFVTFVSPLVLAVLPFWKTLADKASKEAAGWQDSLKKVASQVTLLLAAAVVPVLLWLVMMQLAYWGTAVCADTGCGWSHAPFLLRAIADWAAWLQSYRMPAIYATAALVLFALWPFLSVNSNSLHQLYRDRLGGAFLIRRRRAPEAATHPATPAPAGDPKELDAELGNVVRADDFQLSELDPARGPYHIINTALNVPGSRFANRRGRNADFFIFSKCFIGSEITGYIETCQAEKVVDGLNLGTAVAISGAAAAPNMGRASIRPLSATIALLNVRLGRWVRHPHDIANTYAKLPKEVCEAKNKDRNNGLLALYRVPGPKYLLQEAFFKSGRNVAVQGDLADQSDKQLGFVFLTDGGHIENLGIYELLRRRCRLIIAIDGEADPNIEGPSLTQLERFARIDHNIALRMQWKPIGEMTRTVSLSTAREPKQGPHVALGLIDYPPLPGGSERETGVLVYIKASLSGDENDYVMAYNAQHKTFPHETTADQLFSEEQFEVYRALGEHIAVGFVTGRDTVSVDPAHKKMLVTMVNDTLDIWDQLPT